MKLDLTNNLQHAAIGIDVCLSLGINAFAVDSMDVEEILEVWTIEVTLKDGKILAYQEPLPGCGGKSTLFPDGQRHQGQPNVFECQAFGAVLNDRLSTADEKSP